MHCGRTAVGRFFKGTHSFDRFLKEAFLVDRLLIGGSKICYFLMFKVSFLSYRKNLFYCNLIFFLKNSSSKKTLVVKMNL